MILNIILRNNMSILYTNERMADLFKGPPMAGFEHIEDKIMRVRLDNLLPNGFKTCSDARRLLCKQSTNTASFKSPIIGHTYKIFGNAADNCIHPLVAKFALSNTLVKRVTSADGSTTTALP